MFYSHTFLARKGPLGTVWCAAHLQHRLKKSHYTSTDILSTVDRIMFPEVPIALRMSGHLLLGVVRIYSKKVEYLLHDCKGLSDRVTKAFATIDINLPEDAAQAPVQSVTLPERFDLDALNLDDNIYNEGTPDHHLKSQEDITLPDQIPIERDLYVTITFDEDFVTDLTCQDEDRVPEQQRMEDMLRAPPLDTDVVFEYSRPNIQTEELDEIRNFQDPGTSTQKELPTKTDVLQDTTGSNQKGRAGPVDFREPEPSGQTENLNLGTSDFTPQSLPEVEVMRGGVSIGIVPQSPVTSQMRFPDPGTDTTEPIESAERTFNVEEISIPNLEDALASGEQSLPFQLRSQQPASAVSQDIPDFRIRSSPQKAPREQQRRKPRARKRKFIDESIVLSNAFMKEALKDPSDLLKKRRKLPSSALDLWKWNNNLKKDQVFHEPLITGLCAEISSVFGTDHVAAKSQYVVLEGSVPEAVATSSSTPALESAPDAGVVHSSTRETEVFPEPRIPESSGPSTEAFAELGIEQPSDQVPDIDMGTEQLRHDGSLPSASGFVPPPLGRDDLTPISTKSIGSASVPEIGTTMETDLLYTQDIAAPAGIHGTEFATPRTHSEQRLSPDYSGQYANFELISSAEAEDLHFLEADNNTPSGSQAGQGIDSLSVRTRAVAQYLQRHTPISPVSEGPSTYLSLNKILEGKRRKLCARMFFETLVLKSYGLIDVHQEEPYGDIALELNPILKKTQM